ncbi:TetR/AcrR family transcriptional regulator [Nocardia jinanensis]|uniref:TetR family transcriptional regulator n=1 Tax=Nocardia jinanensis TaxID=382504 RepID=A0A917RNZ1_9NOCA|nr:TetR/AcrR family transcriptional regulator [Nocardia jinanensis]GGL16025.1 TetR family transcriptional regulator [Nocardia jinanensis]
MARSTSTTQGRPRDPDVDRRVADAAIDLFGAAGWAGFTVEAVAKRAGVGKASIYLRWPTKEALLLEALRQRFSGVTAVEPANVREELVQLALQLFRRYVGDTGQAAFRIALEASRIPGVAEHWAGIRNSQVVAARAIVRRGIQRGELPPDTPVTLLLDTLSGAVMNHVQTTPPVAPEEREAAAETYSRKLVDFILANATAG